MVTVQTAKTRISEDDDVMHMHITCRVYRVFHRHLMALKQNTAFLVVFTDPLNGDCFDNGGDNGKLLSFKQIFVV